MKRLPKLAALLLLIGLLNVISCSKDNPTIDLVTFTADALYYSTPGEVENWVVAWNSEGEVIDYKEFTPDTPMKFTTTRGVTDNKITLGLVSYLKSDGRDNLVVQVYTDIPIGRSITRNFTIDDQTQFGESGNFTLNLNGLSYNNIFVSSKWGTFSWTSEAQTALSCYFNSIASKYNVAIRDNDGLRHKILNNVKDGDVFDLSDEDFTLYEHQLKIDVPDSSYPLLFFNGYASDVPQTLYGYQLDWYSPSNPVDEITTGYLDSLSKFAIAINLYQFPDTRKSFNYEKLGSLPGAINWPDKSQFDIDSQEQATFAIATSKEFSFIKAIWQSNTLESAARWEVVSPQKAPKIGRLPDELIGKYPYAQPLASNFDHAEIHFSSAAYDEVLKRLLEANRMDYETTYLYISKH